MKKALILILLLVTAAATAMGASSRENRADKNVWFGISPIGLHIPTLATQPFGAAWILNEDWMVGGEYGTFNYVVEENEADSSGKLDTTFTNLGGFGRWFPGSNSFNMLFAFHKRDWDAKATISMKDKTGTVDVDWEVELIANAYVGTIGVGHLWTYDFGMTLGVDWLAYSSLLSGSSSGKIGNPKLNGTPYAYSSTEKDEAEKELEDLGDVLNQISALSGFLILTLGFSF